MTRIHKNKNLKAETKCLLYNNHSFPDLTRIKKIAILFVNDIIST